MQRNIDIPTFIYDDRRMCGIAGIISKTDRSQLSEESKLIMMHRGPDNATSESISLESCQVNFTHNRLAILDLQTHANQPFWNQEKTACIVFNGEIYNYIEIRSELEALGVNFRTSSDTEVLLQALAKWSPEIALNKMNGMWAFAYLDTTTQSLLISRDRFGKKPFYYTTSGTEFFFASEIKYILKTSAQKFSLNYGPIAAYLEQFLLETNEKETFFNDIYKLEPGSFAKIDLNQFPISICSQRYYKFPLSNTSNKSWESCKQEFHEILDSAVALRLRSDVNMGFLLSGGLDSSLLSSVGYSKLAKDQEKANFFSVVSDDPKYDESYFISKVEDHLGVKSNRINISQNPVSIFNLLTKVQWHNDEPITSMSAISYYLMMEKAASLKAKVLISGQGADEIFCGYKKYLGFYVKSLLQQGHPIDAITTAMSFLRTQNFANDFDLKEIKRYIKLPGIKTQSVLSPLLRQQTQPFIGLANKSVNQRQLDDLTTFSVPALLHYEDRLSMAYGIEVRAPFLDYRIAEFGVNLPTKFKIQGGWSKYIIREVGKSHLPHEVVWRKDKKGFTIPQEAWFRNELKVDIQNVFNKDCLMYDLNLVDRKTLLEKFELYCSPEQQHITFKEVFAPLALENWLQINKEYLKI